MVSQEDLLDSGLKAISDSTRRGILGMLEGRELSVLEIAEEFPMSRPAISKHLKILKEAGLVIEKPAGRQRLYTLQAAPLKRLSAWLARFNGSGSTRRVSGGMGVGPEGWPGSGGPRIRPMQVVNDWRVW